MYVAPPYREERPAVLLAAIREIRFGTLVLSAGAGPIAAHLPMVACEASDGALLLRCHVARANSLWEHAVSGCRALAIFQGPHAYVRPGWYPTKAEDGRVAPTWNYIAVHAAGLLRAVQDERWLRSHVEALTDTNEQGHAEPWAVADAPSDYVAALLRGIVGLEMTVDRLEGGWKLGQAQPLRNRLGAIAGLAASPRPGDREVAAAMERGWGACPPTQKHEEATATDLNERGQGAVLSRPCATKAAVPGSRLDRAGEAE